MATERQGAAHRITAKRPANHHGEHTQTTQATHWVNTVKPQNAGWGRAATTEEREAERAEVRRGL